MAVLTTLVGLLELKHLQMEGEDGTGSLESDIQLIEVGYTSPDLLRAPACMAATTQLEGIWEGGHLSCSNSVMYVM